MLSLLNSLHGTPGLLLLCGLLFAEEAGVPLPFAPGEIVLLAGGLLVATGGLSVFIFVPAAIAVCVAGSMLGFGWAAAAGPDGLHKIARKLHKEKSLTRVEDRVRSAGPVQIGISRLIPGLRIYTTLVAGAVRVERRTFLLGMVPTTVAWVIVVVGIGAAVGIPAQRFFDRAALLVVQGAILVGSAVGAVLAVRRMPATSQSGVLRAPRPIRYALAIVIDLAVLACVVSGVWELVHRVVPRGIGPAWLEATVLVLASLVLYVVVARRGPGATMGEALLQTTYISGRPFPLAGGAASDDARLGAADLQPTVKVFSLLTDVSRLQVVGQLVRGEQTLASLAKATASTQKAIRARVKPLIEAGVVDVDDEHYRVERRLIKPLAAFLSMSHDGKGSEGSEG